MTGLSGHFFIQIKKIPIIKIGEINMYVADLKEGQLYP